MSATPSKIPTLRKMTRASTHNDHPRRRERRFSFEDSMKERPILFSGAMVRALLDGRKTQTRRVIKDQKIGENYSHTLTDGRVHLEWLGTPSCGAGVWDVPEHSSQVASPYGVIGDRLWVREAWRVGKPHDETPPRDILPPLIERGQGVTVLYEAGGWRSIGPDGRVEPTYPDNELMPNWAGKRRPSMFMPRALSRITLEVTGVRVERLQDISEQDATVEGVSIEADGDPIYPYTYAFAKLWEQLNGKGSWLADPWVWVVEFRRVQ
jgi:hypothetical protein